MKKLVIILTILGIGALCYNYFMLQPNLNMEFSDYSDMDLYSQLRMQSDISGLAGTALMGIAAILGLISFAKTKDKSVLLFSLVSLVGAIVLVLVAFGRVM